MALFDSDFLTRLEYLSIVSRKVFRGQLMAQRRTRQMGSGIEFADHRQYTAGDDFRYLDWNLYARHGELLLKRFQEEEDLHVYLLLDCSNSMDSGDPSKFDLARQVTAALAYVALADLDRISVYAFANGVLNHFPLTRGKARILSLMKFLESLQATGEATNISVLTREFVVQAPRKGLAVMLSDMYDPGGFRNGLDVLRHHKFEPHVIQVHSQAEADPRLLGDVELQDIETRELRKITITEKHLKNYKAVYEQFLQSIREYCSTYGIGYTIADNKITFDKLVLNMMRASGTG